jgi:hypothetical protein
MIASEVDWRMLIKALADYLETYSDLILKTVQMERDGVSWQAFNDPNTWSKAVSGLIKNVSKEQFLHIMGIVYDLGRISAVDVFSLPVEEKQRAGEELKRGARSLKEVVGG